MLPASRATTEIWMSVGALSPTTTLTMFDVQLLKKLETGWTVRSPMRMPSPVRVAITCRLAIVVKLSPCSTWISSRALVPLQPARVATSASLVVRLSRVSPSRSILDRILVAKRRELEEARDVLPLSDVKAQVKDAPPVRDFAAALRQGPLPKPRIIAEFKRRSPSAGDIRAHANAVEIAQQYM